MDRVAISALRGAHGYPQLMTAATVARIADEMFFVGVVLLILDRTGSPSLAGLTVAAATVPAIVSGPVIGAWLDRTGRRSLIYKIDRLVLVCVLGSILAAAGNAPNFVLPLLAFLTGITLPVAWTGFTSMIPLIVEEDMLPSANAVESASLNMGMIGGPALAGGLAAIGGPGATLVGEAALTLVALFLILRIPDLDRGAAEEPQPLGVIVRNGLRHVMRDRVLRNVSLAGIVNNIGWGVLVVAFPLWAVAELGSSASASGALWAAFAAGSLLGAFALARLQARHRQQDVLFAGMVVMGALMLTWDLAAALPVALALVALTAVVEGPAMAAVFTLRQVRTPATIRAQVMGTLGSASVGAFAVGSALGGPLLEATDPRTAILAVGAAILSAGAVGALATPRGEAAASRPGSQAAGASRADRP